VDDVDELQIVSLRTPVTIWFVRIGDDVYVRSYRGPDGKWFQAVSREPGGRVRIGGDTIDVTFVPAGDDVNDAVDEAYRAKYRSYLDTMTSPRVRATTMRLERRNR
jgi:hypothetical protein